MIRDINILELVAMFGFAIDISYCGNVWMYRFFYFFFAVFFFLLECHHNPKSEASGVKLPE